jgi:hypothetical protein
MTTISLESIKAAHEKVGEMIAQFESAAARLVTIPQAVIALKVGEYYAGITCDDNGMPSHHLILLPGEAEGVNWLEAIEWATKSGGELPTRPEQALLYANLKGQFQEEWYWSGEQHAIDSDCAWIQGFSGGNQYNYHESRKGRARAVRRLPI